MFVGELVCVSGGNIFCIMFHCAVGLTLQHREIYSLSRHNSNFAKCLWCIFVWFNLQINSMLGKLPVNVMCIIFFSVQEFLSAFTGVYAP